MKSRVFVFGSNLAGRHGKGPAKEALLLHGAVYGQGVGRQGRSYAIPTRTGDLKTLPLPRIEYFVHCFVLYAKNHPELIFDVVAIGCGNAGYTAADIAPMFKYAPGNCVLPEEFKAVLST